MTIRTQADGLNGMYSEDTGIDCSDRPDMTRQEFKDETDVNKVLARYGVNAQLRAPEYGEVDYNLDLQQSLNAIREAERAVAKLPPELKTKYNTWQQLFDGAANGAISEDLTTYFELQKAERDAEAQAAVDKANPPV